MERKEYEQVGRNRRKLNYLPTYTFVWKTFEVTCHIFVINGERQDLISDLPLHQLWWWPLSCAQWFEIEGQPPPIHKTLQICAVCWQPLLVTSSSSKVEDSYHLGHVCLGGKGFSENIFYIFRCLVVNLFKKISYTHSRKITSLSIIVKLFSAVCFMIFPAPWWPDRRYIFEDTPGPSY